MLEVGEGEDGVGRGDVAHGHALGLDVARGEGGEVFLLLPGVVMLGHRPVDGVVFKFESSEQVQVICVEVG